MEKNNITISNQISEDDINDSFDRQISSSICQIKLQDCNNHFSSLLKGIVKLQDLTHLFIEIDQRCLLTIQQYTDISHALSVLQNITCFKIILNKKCFIRTEGIIQIGKAIQSFKCLKELSIHIEKNNYIGDEGYQAIKHVFEKQKSLIKLSMKLVEKDSSSNEGVNQILASLKEAINVTDLELNICFHFINRETAMILGQALESLQCLRQLKLNLDFQQGGHDDSALAESLGKLIQLQQFIFKLKLKYPLKEEIRKLYIRNLQFLSNLQELKVEGLLSDQDFINNLQFPFILKSMPLIKNLHLEIHNKNEFSIEVLKNYGESLLMLKCIEQLSIIIHSYTIDGEYELGFQYLLESLKTLETLIDLKLIIKDNNKIFSNSEYSMKEILQKLIKLQSLELYFGNQTLSLNGISNISQGLKSQKQLQRLHLTLFCHRHYDYLSELVLSIQHLTNLTILYLDFGKNLPNSIYLRDAINQNDNQKNYMKFLIFSLQKLTSLKEFFYNQDHSLITDIELLQYISPLKEAYYFIRQTDFLSSLDNSESEKYKKVLNNLTELQIDIYSIQEQIQQPNNHSTKIQVKDFQFIFENLKRIEKLQLKVSCFIPQNIELFYNLEGISNLTKLQSLNLEISHYINQHIEYSLIFKSLSQLVNLKLDLEILSSIKDCSDIYSDLEMGLFYLTKLKKLKFKIKYSKQQNNQIYYSRFLKTLSSLEILKLVANDEFKDESQQQDFCQALSSLKNLKVLDIKALNYCYIHKLFVFQIQSLNQLQQFTINFQNKVQNEKCSNIETKQKLIQVTKNIKEEEEADIKQLQISSKQNLENLQEFTLVLQQNHEYWLNNFQFFLKQITNIQFLHKLTIELGEYYDKDKSQSYLYTSNDDADFNIKNIGQKYLRNLELIINNHRISDTHSELIASYLSSLQNLETLKIQTTFNSISSDGMSNLLQQILSLTNLKNLNLKVENDFNLNDKKAESFFLGLQKLQKLQILKITIKESKLLSSDSLISISKGLSSLKQITDLELILNYRKNQTNDGEQILIQSLQNLKYLQSLTISLCNKMIIKSIGEMTFKKDIYLQTINKSSILPFDQSKFFQIAPQVQEQIIQSLIHLQHLTNVIISLLPIFTTPEFLTDFGSFINKFKNQIIFHMKLRQKMTLNDYTANKSNNNEIAIFNLQSLIKILDQIQIKKDITLQIFISFNASCYKEQENYLIFKKDQTNLDILQNLLFVFENKKDDDSSQDNSSVSLNLLGQLRNLKQVNLHFKFNQQLQQHEINKIKQILQQFGNAFELIINFTLYFNQIQNELIEEVVQEVKKLKSLRCLQFYYSQETQPQKKYKIRQLFVKNCKGLTECLIVAKQNEQFDID